METMVVKTRHSNKQFWLVRNVKEILHNDLYRTEVHSVREMPIQVVRVLEQAQDITEEEPVKLVKLVEPIKVVDMLSE